MAGYRPKSLDELNDMYGKTIAAEKAIRKGTSLLEKSEENKAVSVDTAENIQTESAEIKQSQELSDAVNDFIAKFATEAPAVQVKKETGPKPPRMTVLTKEPTKVEAPLEINGENPEVTAQIVSKEALHQETTVQESYRSDRDNLMDEYIRIMTDADDDVPEKKVSRKEKKKKKKREKDIPEAPSEEISEEIQETPQVGEVHQAPASQDTVDVEKTSAVEQENKSDEPSMKDEGDDFSFPENYTPEWIEKDIEKEELEKTNSSSDKGKKARKKKKDKNKKQKENLQVQESEDAAEPYELVFEEYEPAQEKEDTENEKITHKSKNGFQVFAKVILSLLLIVFIAAGTFATVFKTVLPVNTGKAVNDTYYIFTAQRSYPELGLAEGDLIITEKVYAEDGDVFAYIDYSEKVFEFGKRSDSITNDDGEVLLVTEKSGSRALVSRDDCKGVVYQTYPVAGRYIGIITENFVIVISAIAVACLIIVLILSLAFKSKKDKKDGTEAEKTAQDGEYEEENLFATID